MRTTFHQELSEAIQAIDQEKIKRLEELVEKARRVFIIGNGGSNALANHIEIDYIKCLDKPTVSMSNNGLTTALVNDYDTHTEYVRFLECQRADEEDLVVLISSSGNSRNIKLAGDYCIEWETPFIIMTGFDKNNDVRQAFKDKAYLDLWVDSKSYGIVELTHEAMLHAIVDN